MLWGWVESGPELVGLRVVFEAIKDGQCVLPGYVCGFVVSEAVVGVSEADECVGLAVLIVNAAVQVDGELVVGDGLGVVAKPLMGGTQGFVCFGQPVTVSYLLVQGYGLLAGDDRLLVVAERA